MYLLKKRKMFLPVCVFKRLHTIKNLLFIQRISLDKTCPYIYINTY